MVRAGKVRALMQRRYNVAFDDVRALAKPVLRHRVFLTFEAEAAGVDTDTLVDRLLDAVVAEPVAH
jgi:MoxR-like ATPase